MTLPLMDLVVVLLLCSECEGVGLMIGDLTRESCSECEGDGSVVRGLK